MTLETPLITALGACKSKKAQWIIFALWHYKKHDKPQLLAKFEKIMVT